MSKNKKLKEAKKEPIHITMEQLKKALKAEGFEFAKYYDNGMVMVGGTYMSAEVWEKALTEHLQKHYPKQP
jgi:hypothetical protein